MQIVPRIATIVCENEQLLSKEPTLVWRNRKAKNKQIHLHIDNSIQPVTHHIDEYRSMSDPLVLPRILWKHLKRNIPCQASVPNRHCKTLKITLLPTRPWPEVSIDFCAPFPNESYLMVVIDDYSRYPGVEILSKISVKAMLPKLNTLLELFGIPDVVKTDNSPLFSCSELEELVNHLWFNHRKSKTRISEINSPAVNKKIQNNDQRRKQQMNDMLIKKATKHHLKIGDQVLVKNSIQFILSSKTTQEPRRSTCVRKPPLYLEDYVFNSVPLM